jgi:lysophospholipase L1-like esterase
MVPEVSHKWSCLNFLGEEGLKDPELVRDFSTMNAVRGHLTPPALIISASDDRLVPFVTNGLEYYKAMRNAGNDCAMYVYPTGDHGFGFGHWFKYHDQLLTDLGNWLKDRQTPKPGAIRVACIGNSITDGHGIDMRTAYGYPALLQKKLGSDYWVKNFGVSSRTLLNKGDFPYMNEVAWQDAQAFKPDVVVIKLGTNDSKPQNWQFGSEFRQDLEQMVKALSPARILLCTPIPAFKPSWDISDSVITQSIIPIQKEVAKKYKLQVVDLHSLFAGAEDLLLDDGIHPNGKGCERMAEIISEQIKNK